ncbi:LPXTG cell wall anchor domain-containing protein, partial [Streptomyces sp. NPDC056437]|uniref:LPXTG cell wall anchor domain-containing protein n=1 Tax=Streptomyces sp. NPDC056437 TaxID=3345816 RepID=UPI0036A61BE9
VPEVPTPQVPQVPEVPTPQVPQVPEVPTPQVPEVPTPQVPEVPEVPEVPTLEVPEVPTPQVVTANVKPAELAQTGSALLPATGVAAGLLLSGALLYRRRASHHRAQ